MKLKSQLEAILFLSDKPVKAAAMARIVSQDVQLVRQALLELIHDYEARDGGLEIADDDGYLIQVRDAYASIVDEFAPMEMPVSLIRTLSAIAIKQPVAQSEIIKIRGAGAYDHIKELIIRDLILKKEEGGRSPALSTTKKFQEYFRLTQDAKVLRTQLNTEGRAVRDAAAAAAAAAHGEAILIPDENFDIAAQIITEELAPRLIPLVTTETEESSIVAESDEVTLEINHLESRVELEKVFATSPDASFVFRAPVHESHGAAVSTTDGDKNTKKDSSKTQDLDS